MAESLRADICGLRLPGFPADEVEESKVDQCLSGHVQYAYRYWIGHLQESGIELCDNGQAHKFLKEHFLHWIEALILIGKVSEGLHMITDLSKHLSTLPASDTVLPYHYVLRLQILSLANTRSCTL